MSFASSQMRRSEVFLLLMQMKGFKGFRNKFNDKDLVLFDNVTSGITFWTDTGKLAVVVVVKAFWGKKIDEKLISLIVFLSKKLYRKITIKNGKQRMWHEIFLNL